MPAISPISIVSICPRAVCARVVRLGRDFAHLRRWLDSDGGRLRAAHRGLGGTRLGARRLEHEIIVPAIERRLHAELLRLIGGLALGEVHHQRVLHAEHRVGIQVRIALGEQVGDQRVVALGGDQRVQVAGAHRVAAGRLQELPTGPSWGTG